MNTVHALIVAAGRGVRYGSEDKLWLPLLGKPLWWHAVWRLLTHPQVSGATLVVAPGMESRFEAELANPPLGERVRVKGVGGATRQQSVHHGLSHVPPDAAWIAIHDAARPVVSHALLDRLFACAWEHGAAIPILPVHDTLKRLVSRTPLEGEAPAEPSKERMANSEWRTEGEAPAEPMQVAQTVSREGLYRVQTPQVFRADWLRDAHQRATDAGFKNATDDASLLEWTGYPVHAVPGDPLNIKVTTPEDYTMLTRLMETPMQTCVGIGYDIHPLVEGRKLILGGLEIEHTLGLKGHSDADVVLHAICDALLGAAALGDIGQHFPNTDPRWQDISSRELLRQVNQMLAQHGWQVAHIDATVLAEAPKLAPHVPAMRTRIAETLGVQPEQISLKATTNEGMDAVGEQRAIACFAIATIQRSTHFAEHPNP